MATDVYNNVIKTIIDMGLYDGRDYCWQTANHERILITEMDTSHVMNCIAFLERTPTMTTITKNGTSRTVPYARWLYNRKGEKVALVGRLTWIRLFKDELERRAKKAPSAQAAKQLRG